MPRSTPIQIYLKPGKEVDDMLLALWEACKEHARPQDVFRRMLLSGMDAMIENGEFSPRILEAIGNAGSIEPPERPRAPARRTRSTQRVYDPKGYSGPSMDPVSPRTPSQANDPVAETNEDYPEDEPIQVYEDQWSEPDFGEDEELAPGSEESLLPTLPDPAPEPEPTHRPETEADADPDQDAEGGNEGKGKHSFIGDLM